MSKQQETFEIGDIVRLYSDSTTSYGTVSGTIVRDNRKKYIVTWFDNHKDTLEGAISIEKVFSAK